LPAGMVLCCRNHFLTLAVPKVQPPSCNKCRTVTNLQQPSCNKCITVTKCNHLVTIYTTVKSATILQ
jgi:hypothetical protein